MTEVITFETTVGEFAIELYQKHAPKTCFNFLELTKIGYYDGTIFHRIIHNFVSCYEHYFMIS
jgi:peptidyl-prolyl cis-trans isomerase-like 1